MNWSKRLPQWTALLKAEQRRHSKIDLLKAIFGALKTGAVPRSVWRARLRTCSKCPVYNPVTKACRSPWPGYEHLGCGCYVPFEALTGEPYEGGCWGASRGIGWPAVRVRGRWLSLWRFLRGK